MAALGDLSGGSAAQEIKAKLRLLNVLNVFIIVALLAIVTGLMYEPVSGFLRFLPDVSIKVILGILVVLTAVGFYLSRVLTRQVMDIIRHYSHRLDRVLAITRDIREEIYGDVIFEKIIDCALDLTGSEAGAILLLDGEELVFKVVRGVEGAEVLGGRLPAGQGIAGWVAEHEVPQYMEDVAKNEGFESSLQAVAGYATRSALCVPLQTKSGVIGVIELLNKRGGTYDDGDAELVSYLAEQAAVSIERAAFFEDQRNYEVHMTDILIDTIDGIAPERRGHSKRVAKYAMVLGRAVGMSEEEKRRLYFASLLHDIGYLRGGDGNGAETGYETLNSINFYKDIAPFVRRCRDRYDGGGAGGIEGADIPLQSRIIAVAEAFDSLAGGGRANYESALEGLKAGAGKELDPSLVDLFIENAGDTLE